MGWDFFCKIFCVSVRERTDRRTEARKQFAAVGLLDRVEFYIVEKDKTPEDIERGIYESHIICIQKGLDAGARHILIFEDDIIFDRLDPEKLEACTRFLQSRKEWKILLLGCLVNGLKPTESKAVMKVKYRSLSHAYALNRNFAREIVKIPWPGFAYDCLFCRYDEGVYALYPSIAFQSDSPPGNTKYLNLERRRQFFGGLKRIQKFNEFFHSHRVLIIAANAATVLFLVVIAAEWFF
jgi:GR25 family glycosyltransferase involved in LPS biosynthesis